MENLIKGLGGVVLVLIIVFAVSVIGGTIVWAVWDDCIPYVFKGLVDSGALSGDLTWWQAVTLVWVSAILIKSSTHSKNKKD